MTPEIIAFMVAAFPLANRVRGSQENGDLMLAVLWGLGCAVVGFDKWQCVASGLFMWAAQASSWGAIFGAVGGWFEGEYKAPLWIKWLLKPLEGDPKTWGPAALALRGLHFVPVFLVLGNAGAGFGLALSFYVMYWLGIETEKRYHATQGWEWAEYAFGLGMAMVLVTSGAL